MEKPCILIVEDDQWIREELSEFLLENDYTVFQAGLPSQAFEIADANEPDIVILDIKLPEKDGLEVLKILKQRLPETEVIMITGHGDMDSVIQAMRFGASDYLTKPFRLPEVQAAIERTQKFIRLNKKFKAARQSCSMLSEVFYKNSGYEIITHSKAMKAVTDLMSKVAAAEDTSVLITGESGTGKEVAARGIHLLSRRKEKIFIPVNVASVTDSLFESEFFGHKKGTFTGALDDRPGWFETASGGTLFLDEICSMPSNQQPKLNRVLEDRKIVRLGSQIEIPVNARVIAATNRNIKKLISENRFRKDLYYRLNTFVIHIPPLRQRKEDIPLLFKNFVNLYSQKTDKELKSIDDKIISALHSYDFPGNVRELKNMVERAVILCDGKTLNLSHFPDLKPDRKTGLKSISATQEQGVGDLKKLLELTEKSMIFKALQQSDFNKSKAAAILNISRQSLHRRMKKFNISQ